MASVRLACQARPESCRTGSDASLKRCLPASRRSRPSSARSAGTVADPAFYKQPAAQIATALERAEQIERELGTLYARWAELDSRPT